MTTSDSAVHTQPFQAEVSELLHLMVHSVYSETDIFLRELVSNASDACDKLRYEAIESPALLGEGDALKIRIIPNKTAGTLTIADNGIGMERQELIDHLGTIARSGTKAFVSKLKEAKDGLGLIGQFGVGFYSAFMVADKIIVVSRRAGESDVWSWTSSGGSGFEIARASEEDAARVTRGTEIVLHLKDDAKKYLETYEIERIVGAYSDNILFPIELVPEEGEPRQINSASALWQRSKSELSAEDYKKAYQQIASAFDDPAMTLHYRAEGRYSYAVLLFAPSTKPFDLFEPSRKGRVRLYVRRVFITDDADLLPGYLRFIRGVVDSEDLPLNISREMLQNNPQLVQIRKAVATRVVSELEGLAEKDAENFAKIWDAFGAVLKEGIYEDFERREKLLALSRFTTTTGEKRSLKQVVADFKPNQTEIYYLVGDSIERLKSNPRLEAATARGHRGAAAVRSGRCLLDLDADGVRGQAAEVAEPGRSQSRPDPARRRDGRGEEGRAGGGRGRHHRGHQGRPRRARQRRQGVHAPHQLGLLPRCRQPGSEPRTRAYPVAAEPRHARQAGPRDQSAPSDGGGDHQGSGRLQGGRRSQLAPARAGTDPGRRVAGGPGGVCGEVEPARVAGARRIAPRRTASPCRHLYFGTVASGVVLCHIRPSASDPPTLPIRGCLHAFADPDPHRDCHAVCCGRCARPDL
ncbi:HSP90 family molecular chaperone [Bradyrhizobium japonicum]